MRIALLSCGPSADLYSGGGYDTVIGVNRAASRFACDYWCCGDAITFTSNQPIGNPVLVTTEAELFTLRHNWGQGDKLASCRQLMWEQLDNPLPLDLQLSFSACAALLLARHLGATVVDVFGADMHGERDWDGIKPEQSDRSTSRWRRERIRWDFIAAVMRDEGITVNRATGVNSGLLS